MSRIDVLRSLLLQATKGATDGLRKLPPVGRLEQKLRALAPFQAELDDAALTAAVARVASVLAASVRADGAALCVDASFDDGTLSNTSAIKAISRSMTRLVILYMLFVWPLPPARYLKYFFYLIAHCFQVIIADVCGARNT
jgi:hypothetical protein